ncbi:peptidoglycan-binding protein [Microbacterium sp. GXF6406]
MTLNVARKPAITVVAVVAALALGAGTVWAALTALRPAEDPSEPLPYTYVAVADGAVGSEMSLSAVAEWKLAPVGDNRAEGVVTSIETSAGAEVRQGSVLYSVDLRPVVVAEGAVPAFRSIGEGTTGPDVEQLQQMLADLGFYNNAIDGEAGSGTVAAIKAWQKSLDLDQSGIVEASDVVFVPTIPTRVALDSKVVFRGASLGGGEPVVLGLSTVPIFTVPVTDAQAAMIPTGSRVEITSPNGAVWEGFTAEQVRDAETQTLALTLMGAEGAVICAEACAEIPVGQQTLLPSRIITTDEVIGLVVPSAALITTADGQIAVVDEESRRIPVVVIASARGMSVIEGVDRGTHVRVPAKEDGQAG